MSNTEIEELPVPLPLTKISKTLPLERRKALIQKAMFSRKYDSVEQFNETLATANKKFRLSISKNEMYNDYASSRDGGKIQPNRDIEQFCVTISSRSHSGVIVITTIMPPDFMLNGGTSCKYNCTFCPLGNVRSYPPEEPVPLRGSQNDYDVIRQAHSRLNTLNTNHHHPDKLEWIVLGGTWSSYGREIRSKYHHEMIFAANLWNEGINACNTFVAHGAEWRNHIRPIQTLEEEITINRNSKCRIIGITIETRPDEIDLDELRFMRLLGVTRIQMGFQSANNTVLKMNNRGCSIEKCIKGLYMAKVNGFKVDSHWMLDMYGSNPDIDSDSLTRALTDPDLDTDQIKLYPTQVMKDSKLYTLYVNGEYKPYSESSPEQLVQVLLNAKRTMQYWHRTNRIVRDFPIHIIHGGLKITHLHDLLLQMIDGKVKSGEWTRGCRCIRCGEVKRTKVDLDQMQLIVRHHKGSGGDEYFISAEIPEQDILLGFCRLRINQPGVEKDQMEELHGCALVRELHVYGIISKDEHVQHNGIGKMLLKQAEEIAERCGLSRIAVIAGIGVQNYYLRLGYEDGFYMIKNL